MISRLFQRLRPSSGWRQSTVNTGWPAIALLLGLLLSVPSPAFAISGEETDVKAAFLFNFFKFIQWPDDDRRESYALCVPQPGRFAQALKPLDGKLLNGRTLKVFFNAPPSDFKECHMLFITEGSDPQSLITKVKPLNIVTVSDEAHFIEQGGMIGLVSEGSRLGFEVNLQQARLQGVHISAELLKLAQKVIH